MNFANYKICNMEDVALIKKHGIKTLFVGFHERFTEFGRQTFAVYYLPSYKVYRVFNQVL